MDDLQRQLQGCTRLTVYSEYLGLNVTTGEYKKVRQLSEIVKEEMMLAFLLDENKPTNNKLIHYLQDQGFTMSSDGSITTMSKSSTKTKR